MDPNINYDVIGDELRLRQILTNLASNAVKFTDKGFISFRTKLISSDDDQQKIEFSVKDTGIGIDESYKPFIFQSFSQGDLSKRKIQRYGPWPCNFKTACRADGWRHSF